jgi:pimeloyl-ACP methyl ester carboxylesterase
MVLAHEIVLPPGSPPTQLLVLLHGLLGRGSNLLGLARRFVAEEPSFGVVLPDLRMHGDSQALAPPHDLARAAADVRALIAQLDLPVTALAGHSFGGKVALRELADPWPELRSLCVLDASPSARTSRPADDTTTRVLAALRAAPAHFASRTQFVQALAQAGVADALGQWLAKNLVRAGEQLRFGLDLAAIAALLTDYDQNDLWALVEAPPPEIRLCFALGGRSNALGPDERERLRALAGRSVLDLHELAQAGHWLHVDDPEGVLAVLRRCLPD